MFEMHNMKNNLSSAYVLLTKISEKISNENVDKILI